MAAFADQVVVAIQNARLIDELGRSREEISRRADAERSAPRDRREHLRPPRRRRDPPADRRRGAAPARIGLGPDRHARRRRHAPLGVRLGRGRSSGPARPGSSTDVPGRRGDRRADGRSSGRDVPDRRLPRRRRASRTSPVGRARRGDRLPSRSWRRRCGASTARSARSRSAATRPTHYDDDQAQLLQALADQAAIAIQNARLIDELNRSGSSSARRADEERAVREIAARITRDEGRPGRPPADRRRGRPPARRRRGPDRPDRRRTPGCCAGPTTRRRRRRTARGSGPTTPTRRSTRGSPASRSLEARVAWTGDYLNDPASSTPRSRTRFVQETGIRLGDVGAAPRRRRAVRGDHDLHHPDRRLGRDDDADSSRRSRPRPRSRSRTPASSRSSTASSTELARRADAEQSLREIAAQITAIREPGLAPPAGRRRGQAARRGATARSSTSSTRAGTSLRWAFDAGVGPAVQRRTRSPSMTIPVGMGATGLAVAENRVITAGDRPEDDVPGLRDQRPLLRR